MENNPDDQAEMVTIDRPIRPPSGNDEMPIGGGKKMDWSEYPDPDAPPPPPKRKPLAKASKKETKVQDKPAAQPASTSTKNIDQQPLPAARPAAAFNTDDERPIGGAKNNFGEPNTFDEQPIGGGRGGFDEKPIGKGNFNIAEFPEGEQPPSTTVSSNLPLDQKLKSKAVKIRQAGCEELMAMISDASLNEAPIALVEWDKMLKESNPACLDKIVSSFQIFVNRGGNWGEEEIKQLIQNPYCNGKGNVKKISSQLLDVMYQKKQPGFEAVVSAGIKSKVAKTATAYVAVLNQLLPIYGIKKMNLLKPYLTDVIKQISDAKVPQLKVEGMNLLKEGMKWLTKDYFEPILKANNLKQQLKKELDTFWETYDTTIVMSAPKADPETKKGGGKVNLYELSEEVDVFKKFPEKWADGILKAEKWKEKTDAMQELVNAANVPKISANSEYRHITDMCKRLIGDSNVNVSNMSIKILGLMAKGMRKNFSGYAKMFFPMVMSKFKEKKTNVLEEANKTLDEFYYCLALEDCLDDVKQALSDKVPAMRMYTLNWIERYLERRVNDKLFGEKGKEAIKALFPNFEKLVGDGTAEVRQNTIKNLGKIKGHLPEDFLAPLEAKTKRTFQSSSGGDTPSKPSKKQQEPKIQSKPDLSQTMMAPSRPPTSSVRNSQSINLNKTMAARPPAASVIQKKQENFDSYEFPDFDGCMSKLIEQGGMTQEDLKIITGSNAKDKTAFLENLKNNSDLDFEAVIKVLKKMMKDWKESNLVMNKNFMEFLVNNAEKINKREFYILFPCLLDKMGDSKFAESLGNVMNSVIERIPPKTVCAIIMKHMKPSETKKIPPKHYGEVSNFFCDMIDKISLSYLPFKDLIDIGREAYGSAVSKKGAISLFKKMYEYMGEPLNACLDVNLLKGLQPQFKKLTVLSEAEKKPKIQFSGDAAEQVKNQKIVNPLDTLPRTDISNDVNNKFMAKLSDANWQTRKDGIEGIDSLITQNKNRIQITGLTELITFLKSKIADTNKTVYKINLYFVGHFVEAVGKDIKPHAKQIIIPVVDALSDKTEHIRKEAISALMKIGGVLGMEAVLANMSAPLQTDKVEFRQTVLSFLVDNREYLSKVEMKDFIKGIVFCLCDKNKDIRNPAQKILEKAIEKVPIETFRTVAKDVRPAFIKDLNNIFDKFGGNKDLNNTSQIGGTSSIRGASPARPGTANTSKPPLSGSATKKNLDVQGTMQNNSGLMATGNMSSQNLNNSGIMSRTMTQKNLDMNNNSMILTHTNSNSSQVYTGEQPLANTRDLAQYKQQRKEKEENTPWAFDMIKDGKEDDLVEEIQRSFRSDIARKMLSLDYRRVQEAGAMISRLCKDLQNHASLRELNDVIQKWIFMKLWGGNLGATPLLQIIPQLLSILEKKGTILTDPEIMMAIGILRQYSVAITGSEIRIPDHIHTTIKGLASLHSGERVLKILVKEYNVDLISIHKHIKRESNPFYREFLNKLIKANLLINLNQEVLPEISKIKEIVRDPEFIELLYSKFNQTILNGFGFKRDVVAPQAQVQPHSLANSQVRPNIPVNSTPTHPSLPPSYPGRSNMPPAPHLPPPTVQTPSAQLGRSGSASNIHASNIAANQSSVMMMGQSQNIQQNQLAQQSQLGNSNISQISNINQQQAEVPLLNRLNFSSYPIPHPTNPLSEHLNKLNPPNDETLTFFQTLFAQASDKITTQLQNYAKVILAATLKSTISMLDKRNEYPPDRIVNQLNLLQQTLKNKHIIRNVGEVLAVATEFVLKQLVYEDENKAAIAEALRERGVEYRTENFIKIINGVMLRILENANPHQIIVILYDLLIKCIKKTVPSQKTLGLIQKCIGRVANNYVSELEQSNLVELILKFHQYCTELQGKLRPEDPGLNTIKIMLTEICKNMKENIWNSYEKAMAQASMPDEFISKHLQSLGIPLPERPRANQREEQMRKITDMLSRIRTYDQGINMLNSFMDRNPDFQVVQYFTALSYESRFISKVMASLETNYNRQIRMPANDPSQRSSQERRMSSADRNAHDTSANYSANMGSGQETGIQGRIRELRQRFNEIRQDEQSGGHNTSHSNLNMNNNSSNMIAANNNNNSMSHGDEDNPDRASEIRKRITQMRARIQNTMN